jgi:hypothetical protein
MFMNFFRYSELLLTESKNEKAQQGGLQYPIKMISLDATRMDVEKSLKLILLHLSVLEKRSVLESPFCYLLF